MKSEIRLISWFLLITVMLLPITAAASEEPGEASMEPEEIISELLTETDVPDLATPDGTNATAISEGTGSSPVASMNRWEWELVLLTNRERIKAGLPPLTVGETSQSAAHTRVSEISDDYSPTRPNGTAADTVLGSLPWIAFVENIDMGQSKEYPSDALASWMDNAELKSYILHSAMMHIGVGYTYNAASTKNEMRFGYEPENYWEQLLYALDGESYTGIRVEDRISVRSGTEIEDLNAIVEVSASTGTSYWLPLMKEFCSGYDADKEEKQVVTVSALGKTTAFTVCVLPLVPGDLNGDELVDLVDLVRLMKAVSSGSKLLPGDMDADGDMDAIDLIRMAKHLSGEAVVLEGKYPVK